MLTSGLAEHRPAARRGSGARRSRAGGCAGPGSGKPIRPFARRPQTGSNLGEASSPDSSGWTIQSRPSPSRSRFARQPVDLGGDPRLLGRVADGDPPGPGQQRRLDRLGLERACARRRCRRAAAPSETGRSQKIVWPMKPSSRWAASRLSSSARARAGLEAPPDDRREAGVPVPLPRVAAGARPRVGEAGPVALALEPVLAQHPLGDLGEAAALGGSQRRGAAHLAQRPARRGRRAGRPARGARARCRPR